MKNKIIISVSILFFFFLLIGCSGNDKKEGAYKENYLEKGQQITAAVFSSLSGELQNAMENGGVENALDYCNLNALNIVDSLSKIHSASIRRASDKYRNPVDQPNRFEKSIINKYKSELENGNELIPSVVLEADGQYYFYAPIFVNRVFL